MKYVYIGLGGMAGSLLRYLISIVSIHLFAAEPMHSFPFGTLITNISGAFFLGFLTKKASQSRNLNPNFILAIGTGAIGSFTTLSTFSIETVLLIEENAYLCAFLYIITSAIGGSLAAYLGYRRKSGEKECTRR